jgi:hypothetical protein
MLSCGNLSGIILSVVLIALIILIMLSVVMLSVILQCLGAAKMFVQNIELFIGQPLTHILLICPNKTCFSPFFAKKKKKWLAQKKRKLYFFVNPYRVCA